MTRTSYELVNKFKLQEQHFPGKHRDKEYACSPDLPGHVVQGKWRRGRSSLLSPEAKNRTVYSRCNSHTRSLNSKQSPSPPHEQYVYKINEHRPIVAL